MHSEKNKIKPRLHFLGSTSSLLKLNQQSQANVQSVNAVETSQLVK